MNDLMSVDLMPEPAESTGELIPKNPVSKKTMNGINSNYLKSKQSATDAIKYAIKTGEFLLKAKEKVPHGQWEEWVQKGSSNLPFSNKKQTERYMRLAKNASLALVVSDGTIDGTCKAIANASSEEKEQADSVEIDLQTRKDKSIANQMSSESDEWYTPDCILESVFQVMGEVDLDPCSDPAKSVSAKVCFTEQDDGLSHTWRGRVFMNPPYCGGTLKWCRKMIAEDPQESITLVAGNIDTRFFHEMLAYSNSVCFVQGRIQFIPGEGNTSSSSNVRNVLFYKGPNLASFEEHFSSHGSVLCLV